MSYKCKVLLELDGSIVSVPPKNERELAEYAVRTVYQEEPVWALIHTDQKKRLNIDDHVFVRGEAMIIIKQVDIDGPFNPDDLYLELYNPEIYVLRGQ